jgi:hypothetical protein
MTIDTSAAVEAAMAAAADTLAQPAGMIPAGVYEAHQCQTGCGRIADVVLVRLADSDLDILCNICHLGMMMAIATQIPLPEDVAEPGETGETVQAPETTPAPPE